MRQSVPVLLTLGLVFASPSSAKAVDLFVTKTADTDDGVCDADCSLREALDAAAGLPGQDTIHIAAGTYLLTSTLSATNVILSGESASTTVLDGGGSVRILSAGNVQLQDLGFRRGAASQGAAVDATHVQITRCSFSENSGNPVATRTGSIVDSSFRRNTGPGGTLSIDTTSAPSHVTVVGSEFSENRNDSAVRAHGGFNTELEVVNSTFSANRFLSGSPGIAIRIEDFSEGRIQVIRNNTFVGHQSALYFERGGEVINVSHNVFAANQAGCAGGYFSNGGLGSDFWRGHNVMDEGSCALGSTDVVTALPTVGGLTGPGSAPRFHPPLLGGPAVDAGNAVGPDPVECEALDQRGIARPLDGDGNAVAVCDVGAIELAAGAVDGDGDGISDDLDNCPSDVNPGQEDLDLDNQGDACDPDQDGDGVDDVRETLRGTDPLNADSDADGVSDGTDLCPLHADPGQSDADGDSRGDACDVWDPLDLADPTPRGVYLEFEVSADFSVIGATWSLPASASYTSDSGERVLTIPAATFEPGLAALTPLVPGSASDFVARLDPATGALPSLTYSWTDPLNGPYTYSATSETTGGLEVDAFPPFLLFCSPSPCDVDIPALPFDPATGRLHGLGGIDVPPLNGLPPPNDVFVPSDLRLSEIASGDADGDGLSNVEEIEVYGTDPLNPDSDGDGRSDGDEVLLWDTSPLDADSDDDGIPDGTDTCPLLAGSDPDDTDGDGVGDSCDNCPRTYNLPQTDRGGLGGVGSDGVGDACQSADFDQDGASDVVDLVLWRRALAGLPPGVDPAAPPAGPPALALLSIQVLPASDATVPRGFFLELSALGTLSDLSTVDVTNAVIWSSADQAVASVDNVPGAPGRARGNFPGLVQVRATHPGTGLVGSAPLSVTSFVMCGLDIEPAGPLQLALGATQQFTAVARFDLDGAPCGSVLDSVDVTDLVDWSSSDSFVGTVGNLPSDKGLFTAAAEGETDVSADFGFNAQVEVQVTSAPGQ